jgi:hypothetical protein
MKIILIIILCLFAAMICWAIFSMVPTIALFVFVIFMAFVDDRKYRKNLKSK